MKFHEQSQFSYRKNTESFVVPTRPHGYSTDTGIAYERPAARLSHYECVRFRMKVRALRTALDKIQSDLLLASDYLATSHPFTQLIEDTLGLDVKHARGDAWIAIKNATELADSDADGKAGFYVSGATQRQRWIARLEELQREIIRGQRELERIAPVLFSNEKHEYKRKADDAVRRATAEEMSGIYDELQRELQNDDGFKIWADEHRPDAKARKRIIDADNPTERARAMYQEIETAVTGAQATCRQALEALIKQVPDRPSQGPMSP